MTTIDQPLTADKAADAAVKAKHRAMWASGDYPALAHDLIADLGRSSAPVASGRVPARDRGETMMRPLVSAPIPLTPARIP